jgi:hypothetical protein
MIAIRCCIFYVALHDQAPFAWVPLVVEQSFQVPQVCGVMVGVPSSGSEPQHDQAPTSVSLVTLPQVTLQTMSGINTTSRWSLRSRIRNSQRGQRYTGSWHVAGLFLHYVLPFTSGSASAWHCLLSRSFSCPPGRRPRL